MPLSTFLSSHCPVLSPTTKTQGTNDRRKKGRGGIGDRDREGSWWGRKYRGMGRRSQGKAPHGHEPREEMKLKSLPIYRHKKRGERRRRERQHAPAKRQRACAACMWGCVVLRARAAESKEQCHAQWQVPSPHNKEDTAGMWW